MSTREEMYKRNSPKLAAISLPDAFKVYAQTEESAGVFYCIATTATIQEAYAICQTYTEGNDLRAEVVPGDCIGYELGGL